jgi:hypothetical protein
MWLCQGLSYLAPEKDLMQSAGAFQSAVSGHMGIVGQHNWRAGERLNLIESVDDPKEDLLMAWMSFAESRSGFGDRAATIAAPLLEIGRRQQGAMLN